MLQKSNKVVQSNKLIEAKYRLTLQEKRLILWLISQIHQDDLDFKRYEISVIEFAKMMELNSKTQYREMKAITASLITRLIQIENPYTGDLKQMAWLSFVKWSPNGGSCSVEFHPELKPYLLQLKEQFTQISFADLIGFDGAYTARILELTAQYVSTGKRTITIAELKKWCGIGDNEYRLYANFKAKVIEPAKNEINSKTSYSVDYREIKKSRKVDRLEWVINHSPVANTNTSNDVSYIPINYTVCTIPEIVEFCKTHELTLSRDLIDFLLQVTRFDKTISTLTLGFTSTFYRDRCDTESVANSLKAHFAVQSIEFN
jgi:plasmid replication initiation protein